MKAAVQEMNHVMWVGEYYPAYKISAEVASAQGVALAALGACAIWLSGKDWLRVVAIALLGATVGLAAFLYFDPVSPLIPGVTWLILSLAALDYLVMPAQFRTFLVYRLVVSALLLVTGAVVSRTRSQEVCGLLGFVAVLASASTIEAMILKSGGHASPYYVGMILLATCVLGFIPTRPRLHVGYALAVYLTYVVPIVLTDDLQEALLCGGIKILIR